MESNPRLVVKFKLGRAVPLSVLSATDYMRTLSLLGRAFESETDGHQTHRRLFAYLERKGELVYADTLAERKQVAGRQKTATLLVNGQTVCQTCKYCKACGKLKSTTYCTHAKMRCPCPFPRRMQGWGKVQYEQDLEAIDRMQGRLALLCAEGKITLEQHTAKYKWCERMKDVCRGKLFLIRELAAERDAA